MHQGGIPALIKIGGTHADAHESEAAGHGPVAEADGIARRIFRSDAHDTVHFTNKIHMFHGNRVIGRSERAATGICVIIFIANFRSGDARHSHIRINSVDIRTAAVCNASDGDRVAIRCFRSKYANCP